jgi:hypothetical protein
MSRYLYMTGAFAFMVLTQAFEPSHAANLQALNKSIQKTFMGTGFVLKSGDASLTDSRICRELRHWVAPVDTRDARRSVPADVVCS